MRKVFWSVLIVSVVLGGVVGVGQAQSPPPERPDESKQDAACHLELSINELEDGKKINVRRYATNLTGGVSKQIKIGSKVPIEAEPGKFVYLDIGINIDARVYGKEDMPILDVKAEVLSIASDQSAHNAQPIVRQMLISANTLLIYNKSMIIGAADDPNSKRQYQLEVTATKIK